MSNFDQIVSLHLGQAGIQVASAFWELICIEHGVGPDGTPILASTVDSEYDCASALFCCGNRGTYIPRTVFIDSEPNVIDEIKTGAYRELYNAGMMLNQQEDAANNYARGCYTIGSKMIGKIANNIRKIAEGTDHLKCFFLLNSMGGGTGSGFSSLILLNLYTEYPKVIRNCFSIAPGNNYSSAVVEPYNMILQNFATIETTGINFLFDNESMYDICCKKLLYNCPCFTDINRILAMMLSSVTTPMRFSSSLRSSVDDLLTNLIPYPRIHFPLLRYAPINHLSRASYGKITTADLTKEMLSKENQSMKIDTKLGLFISMVLNYQGLVNTSEIYKSIDQYKSSNSNNFVEWCPTGFKVGIFNTIPTVSPMLQISPTDQSATMMMNTTAIGEFFKSQSRRFDLLFAKRSFIHWYLGDGLEEVEFMEARQEADLLVGDFNEIRLLEKDLVNFLDDPTRRKSRNASIRQNVSTENKN